MDEETLLIVFVGASIEVSFVTTEVGASGDMEPWVLEAKFANLPCLKFICDVSPALFWHVCLQSEQTSPVLST